MPVTEPLTASAVRDQVCRELVADLRLLGMHPRLVLADGGEPPLA
jgi:hypothetical protein